MENTLNTVQNISTVIDILVFIKSTKDMDSTEILVGTQNLLLNLVSDDKTINGMFAFVGDLATNGEITKDSLIKLGTAVAEQYLNIPLANSVQFIKNLIQGKSVDQYIIPLLLDIGSIYCAPIEIVKVIYNIITGIDSLLTKVKVKTICGVDAIYRDKYEFHLFTSSKHKISLDNDFYGIHITYKSKHARDAKKMCEKEFEKQLDYKVYQVIGVPIEFLNGTYEKPTTRYEKYCMSKYLNNLEKNG